MTKNYTYVDIGKVGFCAQSSLPYLAWLLLVRHRRLGLESLGIRRRHAPRILKALVRFRLSPQKPNAGTLTLPVFGHLCLRVHRGYKLFNFRDLSATKLFDEDVDAAAAERELHAATQASALDFAPTVLATGPHNRWYSETYIFGARGKKNRTVDPWPAFRNIVVGQLQAMTESTPLQTRESETLLAELEKRLALQLDRSPLEAGLHTSTTEFIRTTVAALRAAGSRSLQLALTHGDYSFVNFIYVGRQVRVIDWEGAAPRSLLHDLFNYFFTELYYGRATQPLAGTMDAAIDLLLDRLDTSTALPETTGSRELYRHFYYLERLEMLLCRADNETRTRVLSRTLEVFREHERLCEDRQENEEQHAHKIHSN